MSKIASYTILAMILMGLLISCGGEGQDSPKKGWVVRTLAGGAWGHVNDFGTAARFTYLYGVAVDTSGNIYVADERANRIRKITPEGRVSDFAGSGTAGFANGAGAAAQFSWPTGVAVDTSGNIYVADKENNRIRKITPEKVVSTIAGSGTAGSENGAGGAAQFNKPDGVAVDTLGNIYVADSKNNRIRKITTDTSGGVSVSTIAGSTAGFANGAGGDAQFNYPYGVAVDLSGNIYVADSFNHRIRKITTNSSGDVSVSTIAGSGTAGFAKGVGTAAQFNYPTGVAVDSYGNIYVADSFNHRIRKITTDTSGDVSVSSVSSVSTIAGSGTKGFADGAGRVAQFDKPVGVAVDSSGNIYVADSENNRIRKIEYFP